MRRGFQYFALCFMFLLGAFDVEAQQIEFPRSHSLSAAKKVRDDIFGNEASVRLLSSYVQTAHERGILEAAFKQIRVSDYVNENESWLSTRGVSIKWPDGVQEIEKAKFLASLVAEISPYDRSQGNRNLGMEVRYFRTEETAQFLNGIYGGESFKADPVSINFSENLNVGMAVNIQIHDARNLRFVSITDHLSAEVLQSFGVTDPVARRGADQSGTKHLPHLVLDRNGTKIFIPVRDSASLKELKELLDKGNQPSFAVYSQNNQSFFSARFAASAAIQPDTNEFAVLRKASQPNEQDQFVAGDSFEDSHLSLLENRSELYIGTPEAAAQAYVMIDKDYAAYLAKNEQARQEREARELVRSQRREAKRLLREKEKLERAHKTAAAELLRSIEAQGEVCEEPAESTKN